MIPSFAFSFLFFFFFFFFIGAIGVDLIHETCKKSAKSDPNLSYNFCVTSLQAVPESHHASLEKLGRISIKLTKTNATHTHSHIKKILKHEKFDPFFKSCLMDCLELYSDATDTLKEAVKDFKSSHYSDANIKVGSAMDASATCEDGFKEKEGIVSPLTKKNNDMFQLAAMALSIINMVRHVEPTYPINYDELGF